MKLYFSIGLTCREFFYSFGTSAPHYHQYWDFEKNLQVERMKCPLFLEDEIPGNVVVRDGAFPKTCLFCLLAHKIPIVI